MRALTDEYRKAPRGTEGGPSATAVAMSGTTGLPEAEIVLHDNRAMFEPAAGILILGLVFLAMGSQTPEHRYLLALGGFACFIGGVLGSIALMVPRRVTLSAEGLTIRTRSARSTMAASAIEAVGVTQVNNLHFLTLWYDTDQVPELPADLAFYVNHQAPCGNGKIYLQAVGPPLKRRQIESAYRLVTETGLGEWRDYPTDPEGAR